MVTVGDRSSSKSETSVPVSLSRDSRAILLPETLSAIAQAKLPANGKMALIFPTPHTRLCRVSVSPLSSLLPCLPLSLPLHPTPYTLVLCPIPNSQYY